MISDMLMCLCPIRTCLSHSGCNIVAPIHSCQLLSSLNSCTSHVFGGASLLVTLLYPYIVHTCGMNTIPISQDPYLMRTPTVILLKFTLFYSLTLKYTTWSCSPPLSSVKNRVHFPIASPNLLFGCSLICSLHFASCWQWSLSPHFFHCLPLPLVPTPTPVYIAHCMAGLAVPTRWLTNGPCLILLILLIVFCFFCLFFVLSINFVKIMWKHHGQNTGE